ncbi:rhomboid family intramembrane serine protease [Tahibacter amnicola]|uniref:Rhomboid family intramembrane serine protease n=1 Tax=Tahibacter amnicola TaxID=2976241 RepID=A0ABY6BAD1_9GAMM|nr:rhomboid family intramembrane serine protease [Tahibacter amnicola]UXI66752.1 rhomboid family intramembrane serine protease [Tahibacter amnicola]
MSSTFIILAVTVIVSGLALTSEPLKQQLVLWPPAITRKREYWRLFTYGLVHADFLHLLLNMLTLFFFGPHLERFLAAHLGPYALMIFYTSAIVASIIPSYRKHRNDAGYVSLGASGAVSAVLFAFILLSPWQSLYFLLIPVPIPAIVFGVLYVAYSIYMDKHGQDNINHGAHLWGAAYGVLFMLVMEPRVLPIFLSRLFGG